MNKLDKAIQGLETCIENIHLVECPKQCPYYEACNKYEKAYAIQPVMRDALELLKAQKPRVMTLEELKNNVDNPCWFESHGTYMGRKGFWIIPYMFSVTGMMSYVFPLMQTDERGNTHYSELGTYVYGTVWRCWTSRPTDEQWEAVKWA